VEGYLISATGSWETAQFRMEEFHGSQADANKAQNVCKLLEMYQLSHNVDYMITYNATNNDTAMNEVAMLFSNVNVVLHSLSAHIHCFGHVMYFVVMV
jgi:hypothetical protein